LHQDKSTIDKIIV